MAKVKKEKTRKNKRAASSDSNFLALHGEKFVFIVLALLAVWLMTKGSGLAPFILTASDVTNATKKAEDHIKNNKVPLDKVDKDLEIFDYLDYASLIKSSLKPDNYDTGIRWEQSLFPEKILRPDITPLSVENLRAVASVGAIRYTKGSASSMAGMGPMGIMGAMGGGSGQNSIEILGRQWIVVTGLIPIGQQLKDYNEELSRAEFTDPIRDVPKYLSYDIFRGEVQENGETKWDEEPINLNDTYEQEVDKWASFGLDPVSTQYSVPLYSKNSPSLTMECPPMVNKAFGTEVTNLPNIPLMSESQKEDLADQVKENEKKEEAYKKQASRNFSAALTDTIFSEPSPGGKNGKGGNASPMGPMGALGPGMGPGMGPMGGMGVGRQSGGTGNGMGREAKVDYYLFRFFDFGVKEGVTYQYKVRLYLANPNYKLSVNLVEDGNSVNQVAVVSPDSKPSNPVSLGSESRILVESIEPGSRAGQEPKISVASIYFNTEDAKESMAAGKKLVRGQVANFMREQHKPLEIAGSGVMGMGGMGGAQTMDFNKRQERVVVDHESDICILDAEGGEKINGTELRAPAKMLVMGANGLLSIHDEATDKSELRPYQNAAMGLR